MSRPTATPYPDDPARWDAFVSAADPGSYLQLSPWAAVKVAHVEKIPGYDVREWQVVIRGRRSKNKGRK